MSIKCSINNSRQCALQKVVRNMHYIAVHSCKRTISDRAKVIRFWYQVVRWTPSNEQTLKGTRKKEGMVNSVEMLKWNVWKLSSGHNSYVLTFIILLDSISLSTACTKIKTSHTNFPQVHFCSIAPYCFLLFGFRLIKAWLHTYTHSHTRR